METLKEQRPFSRVCRFITVHRQHGKKLNKKRAKPACTDWTLSNPHKAGNCPFIPYAYAITYKKDRRLSPVCGNYQPVSEVLSYILQNLQ